MFLSLDEYQLPEVREKLFERYLYRHLGYSKNKEVDNFEEKVIYSNCMINRERKVCVL